jgi:hypothetical protein
VQSGSRKLVNKNFQQENVSKIIMLIFWREVCDIIFSPKSSNSKNKKHTFCKNMFYVHRKFRRNRMKIKEVEAYWHFLHAFLTGVVRHFFDNFFLNIPFDFYIANQMFVWSGFQYIPSHLHILCPTIVGTRCGRLLPFMPLGADNGVGRHLRSWWFRVILLFLIQSFLSKDTPAPKQQRDNNIL